MVSGSQHPHILEIQYMGALRKNNPESEQVQINGNETISEIIDCLSINSDLVGMAILNDDFISLDAKVEKGGKLKLLAFVGGG